MQYIIILVLVTTREYYFVILDGVWECAHVGKHCAHVGHAVVATSIAVKIAHPFIRHACAFKIVIAAVLSEPKSFGNDGKCNY